MLSFLEYAEPVAVLPMHDSFIMKNGYEADLKASMQQHFNQMFGKTINIDMEYNDCSPTSLIVTYKNLDELVGNVQANETRLDAWRTS